MWQVYYAKRLKEWAPNATQDSMGLTFEEKHEYIPVLTNYRR
jgi:hypothetical protein